MKIALSRPFLSTLVGISDEKFEQFTVNLFDALSLSMS